MAYSRCWVECTEKHRRHCPSNMTIHNRKILEIIREYAKNRDTHPCNWFLQGFPEFRDIIPIVAASSESHLAESLFDSSSEVVSRMMEEIDVDTFRIKY